MLGEIIARLAVIVVGLLCFNRGIYELLLGWGHPNPGTVAAYFTVSAIMFLALWLISRK